MSEHCAGGWQLALPLTETEELSTPAGVGNRAGERVAPYSAWQCTLRGRHGMRSFGLLFSRVWTVSECKA